MYEQSHRDYLRSGYLHHRLPVMAVNHYRDNAITYKAQRMPEKSEAGERGNTDMQMRQRDVAALDAKYTKELADAKAENDALRDDVAAGRRRLLSKQSVSSRVKLLTASGVDNAASPRLADTAESGLFHLRKADHYAKTTGREPRKYINEQCR